MRLCRVERSSTYSQRRVRLPDSADFSRISAKMDNGVLKLDVPKQEVRPPFPSSHFKLQVQHCEAINDDILSILHADICVLSSLCRRRSVSTPSMWSRRPAESLTEGRSREW